MVSIPQVWDEPALRWVKVWLSATATGAYSSVWAVVAVADLPVES